jgi:hypothetical protein
MSCDEFLEWIKTDFDYLFEDYHFKVIYIDAPATREDPCLVILESLYYRLKFYRSYETANVMFGGPSALLEWGDGKDDAQSWFALRRILGFVSNVKPDFEGLLEEKEFSSPRQQLREQSEALRPLCSKIMLLFQAPNVQEAGPSFADFLQWIQEVDRELLEYLQRKYYSGRRHADEKKG